MYMHGFKGLKSQLCEFIKYLVNSVNIGMLISVADKTLLASPVLENELWMGIQFSESYFGLALKIPLHQTPEDAWEVN